MRKHHFLNPISLMFSVAFVVFSQPSFGRDVIGGNTGLLGGEGTPIAASRLMEQLLMSVRPDLYTSDLDALNYETRALEPYSPECKQARKDTDDEVNITHGIENARKIMDRDLAIAKKKGITTPLIFSSTAAVDTYDPKTSTFSFSKPLPRESLLHANAQSVWDFDELRLKTCSFSVSPRALRAIGNTFSHEHQLIIPITGGDHVAELRVPLETAKALIEQRSYYPPVFNALVDLTVSKGRLAGRIRTAEIVTTREFQSGTVVAARFGRVLQAFPASVFQSQIPTRPLGKDATAHQTILPSTQGVLALEMMKFDTNSLSDSKILNRLPSIIANEQDRYVKAARRNELPENSVFSKEEIMGRSPEFAAHILVPDFRSYMERSAAQIGVRLQSGITLSTGGEVPYIFETSELNLAKFNPLLLLPSRDGAYDSRTTGVIVTVSKLPRQDGFILYSPSSISSTAVGDVPMSPDALGILEDFAPPVIALDRLLTTPKIKMPASEAEKLVSMTAKMNRGIRASVVYVVDGLLATTNGRMALKGKVEKVQIEAPNGDLIASFDATQFPSASVADDAARQADTDKRAEEQRKREAQIAAEAAARQRREIEEAARQRAIDEARAAKEREIAENQQRPTNGFGPEIAHLQLGISVQQAEAIIRKNLDVVAVLQPKPGSWGYTPAFLEQKTFVGASGSDMIAIFTYPAAGNRVVAISRRVELPLPAISQNDLTQLLQQKNGPATEAMGQTLVWAKRWRGVPRYCKQIMSFTQHHGFSVVEGALPVMRGRQSGHPADEYAVDAYMGLMAFDINDARSLTQDIRECPTTFAAFYNFKPDDPSLKTAVFDGAWLLKIVAEADRASSPGKMDAVKGILDQ